jgi:4-hydroxybenzoate polyprenyltransferase
MTAALSIAVAALMGLLAWRKGFNPLLWLFAGGIPGALALLLLPSAKAAGLDDTTKAKRRRRGNIVGAAFTGMTILALAAFLFLFSLQSGVQ